MKLHSQVASIHTLRSQWSSQLLILFYYYLLFIICIEELDLR